jgi:hypothetical protein
MGIFDIILVIIILVFFIRQSDKVKGNQFLWAFYALTGYGLGLIPLLLYVFLFNEMVVSYWGKDVFTVSFIAATVLFQLGIPYSFLILLRKIYSK